MYRKKLIFWSACAAIILFGAAVMTLGSILPDLRDKLGLTDLSAGTLFSVLPIGMLTGALFFGPIADRYGYKVLLAVSCFLMFAGFEGIAATSSTGLITFFVYLSGCGGGAINGSTSALVADISENDKGAKLSLLGFFFGAGALGMPLILGFLKPWLGFELILAIVGGLTLATGILFLFISFPDPKQPFGFPLSSGLGLLKDEVLLAIAFFLFLQSSFEGLFNNWTTTYAIGRLSVSQSSALFALSSYAGGMTVMRLLIGSLFTKTAPKTLLYSSFAMIASGLILIRIEAGFYPALAGFILTGAGLAAGFPIMLGFVGTRHPSLSGTAFSIAFSVALIGNMLINYAMGIIAGSFGIIHLITITFIELGMMIVLSTFILRKILRKG
jgi:MFS transporter, FHS family, glucose/mannose:H+ symporter